MAAAAAVAGTAGWFVVHHVSAPRLVLAALGVSAVCTVYAVLLTPMRRLILGTRVVGLPTRSILIPTPDEALDGLAELGDPTRMFTKPFVLVTTATLALFVYIGVMVPLLPRLIEEQLGGNEIDIGLNLAVFSIAAIMIRPRLGRFAERHGLRTTMVGGALLAAVATAACTFINYAVGIAAAALPARHRRGVAVRRRGHEHQRSRSAGSWRRGRELLLGRRVRRSWASVPSSANR